MCLAIPGRITEITEDAEPALRRGKVDFAGVKKEISLAFMPDAVDRRLRSGPRRLRVEHGR